MNMGNPFRKAPKPKAPPPPKPKPISASVPEARTLAAAAEKHKKAMEEAWKEAVASGSILGGTSSTRATGPFTGSFITGTAGSPYATYGGMPQSDQVRAVDVDVSFASRTARVTIEFTDGSKWVQERPLPPGLAEPKAREDDARVATQRASLNALWEFIEERGLMAEAVAWCDERNVSTSN